MLRELPPDKRIEAELKFLTEAGEVLASSLDVTKTLTSLARLAVPRLADWCVVDIVDEHHQLQRVAIHHADPSKLDLASDFARRWPQGPDAPVWEVIRTGKSVLVKHMSLTELEALRQDDTQVEFLRRLQIHSWLIAPLSINGEAIGTLTLAQAETKRHFDEEDLSFLLDLARRAAVHVQNARLFERSERQRETLETLNRVGAEIAAQLQQDRLVNVIIDAATKATSAQIGAYVFRATDANGVARALHAFGGASAAEFEKLSIPPELDFFEMALGRRAVRIADVSKDSDFQQQLLRVGLTAEKLPTPLVSFMSVPVGASGALFFGHSRPAAFTEQTEQLAEGLAAQAAIAMENARLFDEVRRANKELDRFAYIASHDLKAPLRGIFTLTTFLEEDAGETFTPAARSQLQLIRGRVLRMERLVQGILEYSRAGKSEVKAEQVHVGALVAEQAELLNASTIVTVAAGFPTVKAVRVQLQQVFLNLLSNALKHSKRGDKQVSVSARSLGHLWEFAVSDNGPGIAPEFHSRIFEIFQTLDEGGDKQNTGIGLAVVRRIVEGRGGTVWVESTPGSGATFKFTWPRS